MSNGRMKTLLLFIHGLGGKSSKTWGEFPRLIEADAELAPVLDVGFYSFPTGLLRIPFFSPAPKIQTLASGLDSELRHRHKKYPHVILVAHSLGGLVARQYLVDCVMGERDHPVLGLVLYAVPHDGAGLASVAKYLSWRHPQLQQLCKQSDLLENLNSSWARLAPAKTIPSKYVIAGTDGIVSKTSAQAYWGNDSVETVVNKGHIDVVKPRDADDLAFIILKNFVRDKLLVDTDRSSDPRIPNNLPHINKHFTGRKSQLTKLHQSLQEKNLAAVTQPVALHGLGGVGKTQLAIQYAWQYRTHYSALLWVEADTELGWESGMERLADVLEIPPAQSGSRLPAVHEWLHRHGEWLLIVDNIDSDELRRHVLKQSEQFHNGCWLFTSRLSQWSPQVAHVDLDRFSEDEAIEFLQTRLERSADSTDAANLSERLGYLPLALEQAAAYMLARGLSIEEYLALLTQQPEALLQAAPQNYPRAVWETWSLSRHASGEDAQTLMLLLCCFAPEPLPREVIMQQAQSVAETLWSEQENGYRRVDEALTQLVGYSLIRIDQGQLSAHRLLHQVTRLRAQAAEGETQADFVEAQRLAQSCLASVVNELNAQDVRDWPQLEPLITHIEYCTKELNTEWTAQLLNKLGLLFLQKAQYSNAEPLMRRALAIDEDSFGPDHSDVARDLNNLATLLQATNRLEDAEPLMRRALAIDEDSFGPDHPNVAIRLNNLATLLQDTNRLEDAEPLMRRALAIDEDSLGPDHPDVARDLNNLATLLQATNRLEDAEPLMRRALAIDEDSFGPDHPDVARHLNNLATLLQATNRLEDAEPLMRRALAIDEDSFGPDHPDVARHLNNLATLLQATNRMEDAEPLMRRALAIDEDSFGPDHPDVARHLNNLAQLLQDTNRLEDAEPLMRRALAIDEDSFGPDHPDVARDLNNLAQLLQDTNRLEDAEPLMRRALAIDEDSFGPDHPDVARHLNNLAQLLKATNRLEDAEPLMRRALAIDEDSFGPDHPDVARHLNNLATLLQATNRMEDAEPLMRRALAIDEDSFGPDHPDVARHLNNLAQLLKATNRLEDAEPLMRRALSIFKNSLGETHPNTETVNRNYQILIDEMK